MKKDIPQRDVEVTTLFDVFALKPKIGKLLTPTNNYFHVDEDENIYFLDSENHRILKFSKNGDFITQIGSIGQGKEDLYYPGGVYVKKNRVFVLNGGGVKIFTSDGEYLSDFKIKNIWAASSIYVYHNRILIDVRYKDIKEYNKNKLISIFDLNGHNIIKLGRIIKCQKWGGYLNFNSCFIDVNGKKIFGTFPFYPIIFCYDFDGTELLYKDLRDLGIPEIDHIQEEITRRGLDTPESIQREEGTSTMEFCSGFGVNKKKHMFYAVNIYNPYKKHSILHLDEKGRIIEKIILRKDNEYLETILRLFLAEDDTFYGIGSCEKTVIVFKFKDNAGIFQNIVERLASSSKCV